jgi:TfoX/Sxy family transcriptional regulator of competence genes
MKPEDEALAARIRSILKRRKGYSEQKMFGGICFMLNGNMCVGPWHGSLIVRLDKSQHDATQSEPYVKPMDITGKVMKGWAIVDSAGIESDDELKAWIRRAAAVVSSLPSK